MMDVSGGDSFTDLYGPARFHQITIPKIMALKHKLPLILLPQTYGPFYSQKSRDIAAHILKNSTLAYARDRKSLDVVQQLLKQDFDPKRHRLGIDLAYCLPRDAHVTAPKGEPIGINVSGLLWNDPKSAKNFNLNCHYQTTILSLIEALLTRTNKRILLIPHVSPKGGESDLLACLAVKEKLGVRAAKRIEIVEGDKSPSQLKYIISNCCWVVGARMHATIAALSTATPVANMAYSDKAQGVFQECGANLAVYDMRQLNTSELISLLLKAYDNRHIQAKTLQNGLQQCVQRWHSQMDGLCNIVLGGASVSENSYA